MTLVDKSLILPVADKIDASYRSADPFTRQMVLQGLPGALPCPNAAGADSLTFTLAMASGARNTAAASNPDLTNNFIYGQAFQGLQGYFSANGGAGQNSIAAFAAFQNALSLNSCLYPPNFAALYWSWVSAALRPPSLMLPAGSVFAAQATFSASTVGGGGAITAGLTGNVIRTANGASIVQTLVGTASGGTFTLEFRGQTTAGAIARNASAATIQTALQALPGIGSGNVLCTGGALGTAPVVCTFAGSLAASSAPLMIVGTGSLTGGTVTVSDTTQGYTPAPGVQATASVAISGTLSAHVTYSGQNAAGADITGKVGTLVLDSLAAGATTIPSAWTPQTAGDRIASISAIAATGSPSATSGAFALMSQIERVTS